jgi:hypothetical protein
MSRISYESSNAKIFKVGVTAGVVLLPPPTVASDSLSSDDTDEDDDDFPTPRFNCNLRTKSDVAGLCTRIARVHSRARTLTDARANAPARSSHENRVASKRDRF